MVEPALITRRYEMMIIVAPTVTEQGLPEVIDRVVDYVDNHGGEVDGLTYENPWGRRRLAYPIQDFQDAFYVLMYFNTDADMITPLERSLRLDEQVIRHLIVKYDPMAEYLEMPTLRKPGEIVEEEVEEEIEEEAEALVEAEVVAEAEAIVEAEVIEEVVEAVAAASENEESESESDDAESESEEPSAPGEEEES